MRVMLLMSAPPSRGPPSPPGPRVSPSSRAFTFLNRPASTPSATGYFVSNVNAHATAADNNGYISLVGADGTLVERQFIAGGSKGVTLHGPKGMAIVGRDLVVTDVTVLRCFDCTTGKPGVVVDFAPHGALFLNDVTAAPDGTLYVSDTSLGFRRRQPDARQDRPRLSRLACRRSLDCGGRRAARRAQRRLWDPRANHSLISSITGKTPTAGPAAMACASSPPAPAATTAWSASTTRRSSSQARICRD